MQQLFCRFIASGLSAAGSRYKERFPSSRATPARALSAWSHRRSSQPRHFNLRFPTNSSFFPHVGRGSSSWSTWCTPRSSSDPPRSWGQRSRRSRRRYGAPPPRRVLDAWCPANDCHAWHGSRAPHPSPFLHAGSKKDVRAPRCRVTRAGSRLAPLRATVKTPPRAQKNMRTTHFDSFPIIFSYIFIIWVQVWPTKLPHLSIERPCPGVGSMPFYGQESGSQNTREPTSSLSYVEATGSSTLNRTCFFSDFDP